MVDRRRFLTTVAGITCGSFAKASSWRAGVARVDITPQREIWMAGFAARKQPSQGVALPLHAKALALADSSGTRAVLVTCDLLGLTDRVTGRVAAVVRERHGLPREALLLNASHTHCGPVIDDQLSVAYELSAAQWTAIREYSRELDGRIADLVGRALDRLRPARLSTGTGSASFAANRRLQFTPDGPVDHSVPVLHVVPERGTSDPTMVFGYACHNTTLQADFCKFHGDYAGVAQAELERRHPGATAMFVAGCGADANPKPRGTLDLVNQHGVALADAVDRVLPSLVPVNGDLRAAYATVDLPFAPLPAADTWGDKLQSADPFIRRHAAMMLEIIRRNGALPATQSEPVQIWRFGRDLTLVALGGEVVVDYALWLKRRYPEQRIWAAGYSNDVFAYVPSRRVLEEGGYEGGGAMLYYGKPGPFDESVEGRIQRTIEAMIRK
jgi:neutral ceramidase